jgi:peptidoglycan/LPS O-acetylase OafA/YrhL
MADALVDDTSRPLTRSPAPEARGAHADLPATHDPDRDEAGATLEYRPALDGLRAVAVLAVMIEHSGVRRPGSTGLLVPGGFLGVDVFFVISGFLITSLLLLERRRTGRIDLRRFWLRRARRLLPAVGVMVALTCVLAAVTDLAIDEATLQGDALAALAYVANWRFIVTDQSYFAAFGLPSPFRHLWSLSLEEQWYLVFPPVLVGLLALVRRRTGLLLGVLGAAAAASALWMALLYTPGRDPSRVYYGTDTRAQALLIGALLAVVMVRLPALTRRLARLTPLLGVAGLAALAGLFATVSGQGARLYQGGFAVVALASVAAVAAVALPDASGPAKRALAWRPAVAVGRVSYGLYLWHWPIFVYMTPDRIGLTGAELAAARIAVTFVVATLSFVAVELPIRRHGLRGVADRLRRAGVSRARPTGVAVVLASIVVAVVVVSTGGTGAGQATAAEPDTTVPVTEQPVTTTVVRPGHRLPAVPGNRPLRVMVGGDSQAWSLVYAWISRQRQQPADIELRMVADLACTITPGVPIVDGVEVHDQHCVDWRSTWEATAFDFRPDVVVAMWGAWEVFDHRVDGRTLVAGTPEFAAAYEQALAESIDMVAAVSPDTRIVFAVVPCMTETNPFLGGGESRRNDPANVQWVNEHTAAVVARYAGRAMLVDLGPLVCEAGVPLEEVDGLVPRPDGIHFSRDYAAVAWRYIDERMRPWLAAPAVAQAG